MNKQVIFLFLFTYLFFVGTTFSQELVNTDQDNQVTELFLNNDPLPIKLNYSNKVLKKETNDSTYIESEIAFLTGDESMKNLEVKIRARGKYRRDNCYFLPMKMKMKKSVTQETLFEGNKKLKLVLPCFMAKSANDKVLREYMAYRLYEIISPYHYNVRLLDIDFTEPKGSKVKSYNLKGFFIEDIDNVADRCNGKQIKRSIHPLQQDDVCSVRNDFFQFMIGNTDYSSAYRHNEKLLFVDGNIMPIPYDFDMSGLVDASYSVVSVVQGQELSITDVTQRLYRGFKRDPAIFQSVRQEFLDNKFKMLSIINELESSFDDPKEFAQARKFINGFFEVLEDDNSYRKEILNVARLE
ncbi:hypothetical protein [uncultured Eudoraea sp.]|uniref:hypothetical protein n=1 Tax=uncultured Eudoraea sp. TaxID=1035614 RepID=UPI00263861FB|nr:hypothetical protein [uncultured Eudoraea sp.]